MPISKSGRLIESLEDWRQLAPPKAAHHWVDDRSAKEVARAWLEGGGERMPPEVDEILRGHPSFGPVLSWIAEPEAKLRFDTFAGEPRNSDLAVVVEDARGEYILAVEAKADETYGETLSDAFAAALERRIENPRSKGLARIEALSAGLLQPRATGAVQAGDIRYQLLTACAGALAEAERRGCARAVMLVHEFVTRATRDENHRRNGEDLARFLSRILPSGHPVAATDGVLHGPFATSMAHGVELFVGKVTRSLRHLS